MGISTSITIWTSIVLLVLLGASSCAAKSYRCARGEQYLNHEEQRCADCTHCNASAGLIVLAPCEVHRDTVCGPISKLIEGIRIRHQSHHAHRLQEHQLHHHGVPDSGELLTHHHQQQPQQQDAPFSNVEAIVWDWQAIALTMAVFTCILFFLIIALYSMHQARQWKRLKENFDADVEELSARLSLMAANSQEKGEVLEPSMAPIHDPKCLTNRCVYLEQLLQVRKEKHPHAETGNVYIEESSAGKAT